MTRSAPALHWVATADERVVRLFSPRRTPRGGWSLVEQGSLASRWEDDHEHGRPTVLGRGPSANAAQHFASPGETAEEQRRRFAREAGEWIAARSREHGVQRLSVFAAPRMLGELRGRLEPGPLELQLVAAELTGLPPAELADHPAVRASFA